jgi:predicted transposase YbfD/YdcC
MLEARRSATSTVKSRGRLEQRIVTTTTVGTDTSDWPGLRQFVKLERRTTIRGKTRTTVSYAVASHRVATSSAEQLLALWRGRWMIENRLFWVKDAVMREDHSRIRSGQAAYAMSIIRNAILNYFRVCDVKNIAAELRANALKLNDLLTRLGIFNL